MGIMCLGLSLFSYNCYYATGQSLEEAQNLYNNGNYAQSLTMARQLESQNPKDKNIKLLIAQATLHNGKPEIALTLFQSLAPKLGAQGHIYLAEAYYYNYDFGKAKASLEKYTAPLKKRKKEVPHQAMILEKKISKAEKLLDKTERLTIIDSTVYPKHEMLKAIRLSHGEGTLQKQEVTTLNKGSIATACINGLQSNKVFSSQQSNDSSLNLYTSSIIGGKWSTPVAIDKLNSTADENFPFIRQDGTTLYFARNAEDGLGGYDIYFSRFNLDNNEYLEPSHLGMPFNSPFNDYILAFDNAKNIGYLVSDRYQSSDSVVIYTFVQNKEFIPVADDNPDVKKMWATLKSMKELKDTSEKNSEISNNKQESPKEEYEFDFVITGNRVYHYLKDFKSSMALERFSEVMKLQKELNITETNLLSLRKKYTEGSAEQKAQLTPDIVALEKKQETAKQKLQTLILETRELELRNN